MPRPRTLPFAALALLLPSLPALAAEGFLCRGHDPAWELAGSGSSAATLKLDQGQSRSLTGTAADLAAEGVVVWRGRGGDEPGDVVATLIKGACIDEKDSRTGSHAAILSLPGRALVGCCSLGARSAEAAPAPGAALAAGEIARVRAAPGERINVRQEPGAKAGITARLAGGSEVTVAEMQEVGGEVWYRVEASGLDGPGWIRGDLLAAAPAEAEPLPALPEASAEAAPSDWSQALAELMPAIRACFDATPTKPVVVTMAWPMGKGLVGVRLENGRRQRVECAAPAKGGKPKSYMALGSGARRKPGEGQPVFRPGATPGAPSPCRREEPVTVPGVAKPVGTLVWERC